MPNVREILRLHIMEHMSCNAVAASVGCHHQTVKRIIGRAERAGFTWPLPEGMDEDRLENAYSHHIRPVVRITFGQAIA